MHAKVNLQQTSSSHSSLPGFMITSMFVLLNTKTYSTLMSELSRMASSSVCFSGRTSPVALTRDAFEVMTTLATIYNKYKLELSRAYTPRALQPM